MNFLVEGLDFEKAVALYAARLKPVSQHRYRSIVVTLNSRKEVTDFARFSRGLHGENPLLVEYYF